MRSRTAAADASYRRSDHLVAYWDSGGVRVRNFATCRDLRIPLEAWEVLNAYSTWRTVADAVRRCPAQTVATLQKLSEDLHAGGLLLRRGRRAPSAERAMKKLAPWNPAVGFFHSATRNVTFASLEASRARQHEHAAAWPGCRYVPSNATPRRLPWPHTRSAVSRILLERRSWRRFTHGMIRLQDLSTLLWLTGGIQKWARTSFGEFALKTSPSGGALHPIELYVLARRVRGLKAGFYHYSGAEHRLHLVKEHQTARAVVHYLPQQPWFEPSCAVLFLVAHYQRCLWRYTYARAYRAPFIEAGHLAQTFCLEATALGLAPFVSMALADANVEREIGADGVSRAVLYAAGVGLRPEAGTSPHVPPEGGNVIVTRNTLTRGSGR
jgi:SagB-type dehydrogenase family enzyme